MNKCTVLDQIQGTEEGFTKSLLRKRYAISLIIKGTNQNEFIMCIDRVNDQKPINNSEPRRGSRV